MNESPNESKRALVNNLCPGLTVDENEIERMFAVLDEQGGFESPSGELSIALVSKREISRIHGQFMQDVSPTDVITFPGDSDEGLAGEICVCPEVARDYALQNSEDFSHELALYLAHGYLHLCGFNDTEESERTEMRRAESVAMKTLLAHKAIPRFSLAT